MGANVAAIAASSVAPCPGGGSIGNKVWPTATRRVGATGREWKTSSSATIMDGSSSDQRVEHVAQALCSLLDVGIVALVVVEQRLDLGDLLDQSVPRRSLEAERHAHAGDGGRV